MPLVAQEEAELQIFARNDDVDAIRGMMTEGLPAETAIAYAAHYGAENTLRMLAEELATAETGSSVVLDDKQEIAVWLLKLGADPTHLPYLTANDDFNLEAKDDEGHTGLCRAVRERSRGRIDLYLAAGSDPNVTDVDGRPLLQLAAEDKNLDLIAKLRRAGAVDQAVGEGPFPATIYWSRFKLSTFASMVDSGKGPTVKLPKDFVTPCQGTPSGVLCGNPNGFSVLFDIQRDYLNGFFGNLIKTDPREEEKPAGELISYAISGWKGYSRVTVKAGGPEIHKPEVHALARLAWNHVEVAERDGPMGRIVFALISIAVLVLVLRRGRSATIEEQS